MLPGVSALDGASQEMSKFKCWRTAIVGGPYTPKNEQTQEHRQECLCHRTQEHRLKRVLRNLRAGGGFEGGERGLMEGCLPGG